MSTSPKRHWLRHACRRLTPRAQVQCLDWLRFTHLCCLNFSIIMALLPCEITILASPSQLSRTQPPTIIDHARGRQVHSSSSMSTRRVEFKPCGFRPPASCRTQWPAAARTVVDTVELDTISEKLRRSKSLVPSRAGLYDCPYTSVEYPG